MNNKQTVGGIWGSFSLESVKDKTHKHTRKGEKPGPSVHGAVRLVKEEDAGDSVCVY